MKRNLCKMMGLLATGAYMTLMTGCWGTSGIESSAKVAPTVSPGLPLATSVEVNSARLARTVEITDIQASKTDSGILKANVSVRSKKHGTLQLQYKFAWFDEAGLPVEPDAAAWKPVIIYGKETKTLLGVAPNPTVSQFRLKLRRAD